MTTTNDLCDISADSIISEDAGSWQVRSAPDKNKVYHVGKVGSSLCFDVLSVQPAHIPTNAIVSIMLSEILCCHIHAVNLAELPKEAMTIPAEAVDGVAEKRESLENFIQ